MIENAFKEGAHRVYAECDLRNVPSWKLLEKVGLNREAHFKQNIWFHKDESGKLIWKDTYDMGQIANQMLIEGIFKIKEKLKEKKAEKNTASAAKNTNDYTIRLEKKEDYRAVENLVRESFWNVYRPGSCQGDRGAWKHCEYSGDLRIWSGENE